MSTTDPASASHTLYFGYGSNLWLHQMRLRCPTSHYLGVTRLPNWRWIINERGYANVVEISSKPSSSPTSSGSENEEEVYGLAYSLLPTDEARLDVNEGVPEAYTKETLDVDFWPCDSSTPSWVDVTKKPEKRSMLVYVDRKRVGEAKPKKEYVHRMNMGIKDALSMGVPKEYVHGVMREFIPEEESSNDGKGEVKEKALRQALNFVDENI